MQNRKPIAVVGMAGVFPGAKDLNTFWHNIINKVDATTDVPEDRWIVAADSIYHPTPRPDKAFSKRACLIQDFKFCPEGIDLDPDLLETLDPLYHIVLHAGREAFNDCVTSSIDKERIGIVLASIVLPTDASSFITREILAKSFEEKLFGMTPFIAKSSLTKNQCLAAKVTSLPGAMLARGLGLGGGTYTLDAACASSLYAVKLACDELHFNRADAMLAGGVSRPECLYTQVGFSQLRALSPTGRCAPFDKSADGLVVGEGAGILVMKRLNDALNDGDTIYGLIRGIGLSNDMRGNLLAPDSEGQVRAMRSAYASSGWSPYDIDLIECHGAGTPVGDKVELLSLRNLWDKSGWSLGQCAIGSVKSMIGHLLTGAGAAGMIKTLLALTHRILPPSLNFKKAPEDSPLNDGPFRVQTEAEEWIANKNKTPRRAAVSAFGFGGINAHLLFEEWEPEAKYDARNVGNKVFSIPGSKIQKPKSDVPVAVVGMETAFGSCTALKAFQEVVFRGDTIIAERSPNRWKGSEKIATKHLDRPLLYGGFMDEVALNIGEFHIPPNEIPDILPQHLLMLKVASGAMKDSGLPLREDRPRMGVLIGIDFDFEATNFHLRWNLHNMVQEWRKRQDLHLNDYETDLWLESLRDSTGPPLTATRTLGALGGIIASRIAREFRVGGPSFVVSAEEASGLKALEIGVKSLQQSEIDTVLVGAVDLYGDVRRILISNKIKAFTNSTEIYPFDFQEDGSLPGEGAAALILKRLDQAIADKNRIYAVIKGTGSACGGGIDTHSPSKNAYLTSLKRCVQDAGVHPSTIGYIETHGSGDPLEDRVETEALHAFFNHGGEPCAIGSTKPNIGHCGAAAGLASLVKTCLCLYQEIIPPLKNFSRPHNDAWHQQTFHIPAFPQYWLRDRQDGPRRAITSAMTPDGNCMHVILEECEAKPVRNKRAPDPVMAIIQRERKRPLGSKPFGLFVVEGKSQNSLIKSLDTLDRHVQKYLNESKDIESAARSWYLSNRSDSRKKLAVSIVAGDFPRLLKWIQEAKIAVLNDISKRINGPDGIAYVPDPLHPYGKTAFVFPGSGNHYVGMGRAIGVLWPEILHGMDAVTSSLKSQLLPSCYVPHRVSWEPEWEKEAHGKIVSGALNMIFGQVAHGGVISNLVRHFGLEPSAVIGYSLGESAGLFALGAWPDRGLMLERMLATNLFRTELAGPCNAAREVWMVPPEEDVDWCVATVNRSDTIVRDIIGNWPTTRLLIVNTPNECVIGGRKKHVQAAINALACEAVFLEGITTVHCDAVLPVQHAYKELHRFPTTPPEGINFYSCAMGRSYTLTSESAATSILEQALSGFDFPALIKQAYKDGIRIFLEMGPHSSCTRMISRILGSKPHLAVSACARGEDDFLTFLKFLGLLTAERVPVNIDQLYGEQSETLEITELRRDTVKKKIILNIGGIAPHPTLPQAVGERSKSESIEQWSEGGDKKLDLKEKKEYPGLDALNSPYSELIDPMTQNIEADVEAHQTFLDFSNELTQAYGQVFEFQTQLLETIIEDQPSQGLLSESATDRTSTLKIPAYSREQCMEFATGSVAKVLGPEFAIVDTYKARVRLPDEPLMLVDRVLSVEGEKASLGSGRVVTEHDVHAGAWYLDGNRAPVCISVEAGQADLFLCAYLGIDLMVKGERTYRLLDATVKFHRGLPRPGDVIRYEIEIEKFVRQDDTYLFFFSFEGFIGNTPLITMTHGCAGFFTEAEVQKSGGIIHTEADTEPAQGKKASDWTDLVPTGVESYDDTGVEALRHGDLAGCFGSPFDGIGIAPSLTLPGGRMKLIDRVLHLDPHGGRYGLGLIRAEADIHADDWFLTCHFMDDKVMPGTLMYECCAHTLRIFIQRLGWVTVKPDVCYEPVPSVESVLKCRGPVTPDTRHVIYEVEVKEVGYMPEPYVIADAHMYADGHRIVQFKDLSMKMAGITREEIETGWEITKDRRQQADTYDQVSRSPKQAIFDRSKILAFAVGSPSEAFGKPYQVFDEKRRIARLPGPPYSFLDRITRIEAEAWLLEPDGWIEAEYDVPPDAWYFRANRTQTMPFCVLLEVALQPCGWLAAYMGSALKSEKDLKFRNLGGDAVLYHNVHPDVNTLVMRTRLKQVSSAADMIIEQFDMEVLAADQIIYKGQTAFGFFTDDALAQQVGIRNALQSAYRPSQAEILRAGSHRFEDYAPFTPEDPLMDQAPSMAMPAKALRMIDEIEIYIPDGGPLGLGFIRGLKTVDSDEWFFKAHFYQDPVCPGSLGIESFLQLIKFMALDRWEHLADTHQFKLITEAPHHWAYRGQIIPLNQKIEVEAVVTRIELEPAPSIWANGFLKVDGLYIYKMENFGFRLIPVDLN
jgi:PfaB family protein